jgi:hypothetical protein
LPALFSPVFLRSPASLQAPYAVFYAWYRACDIGNGVWGRKHAPNLLFARVVLHFAAADAPAGYNLVAAHRATWELVLTQ